MSRQEGRHVLLGLSLSAALGAALTTIVALWLDAYHWDWSLAGLVVCPVLYLLCEQPRTTWAVVRSVGRELGVALGASFRVGRFQNALPCSVAECIGGITRAVRVLLWCTYGGGIAVLALLQASLLLDVLCLFSVPILPVRGAGEGVGKSLGDLLFAIPAVCAATLVVFAAVLLLWPEVHARAACGMRRPHLFPLQSALGRMINERVDPWVDVLHVFFERALDEKRNAGLLRPTPLLFLCLWPCFVIVGIPLLVVMLLPFVVGVVMVDAAMSVLLAVATTRFLAALEAIVVGSGLGYGLYVLSGRSTVAGPIIVAAATAAALAPLLFYLRSTSPSWFRERVPEAA